MIITLYKFCELKMMETYLFLGIVPEASAKETKVIAMAGPI